MTRERWRLINQIFHDALERSGAAREAFLREATGDDPDLRRDVESLIRTHGRAGGFLDTPAWGVAPELMFEEHEVSLVGHEVGTYRVIEELGHGGMGVVYAAQDERLGRTVALKALAPAYTSDPVRRERLTREARAAAALSHPAIATIYSLEEIDGELYIVSELVRGRTLRAELAEGPLPPDRLISTLVAVASALAAAHQQGIVHRDLKPENIIRRTDGQIKVLDFGLAQFAEGGNLPTFQRLTETGIALGTPGYMAPEQLGGGKADARTDLFAFGVLTWELATGEHPFGADPAALLARMTELIEGRSGGLSRPLPLPALDRIARRCMRAAPAERYQTAEEVLEDLRALAAWRTSRTATGFVAGEQRLWWWQTHQVVIACVHGFMPVAAWLTRKEFSGQWGRGFFFATLVLATISVTLRLNLWFAARVQADQIVQHRKRIFPTVVAADLLLVVVLLAGAAFIGAAHENFAAPIIVVAVASLASLLLIEPATSRAAGLVSDDGPKQG